MRFWNQLKTGQSQSTFHTTTHVVLYTMCSGWHAKLKPSDHVLNDFDFDVLVGADGSQSTVPGIKQMM